MATGRSWWIENREWVTVILTILAVAILAMIFALGSKRSAFGAELIQSDTTFSDCGKVTRNDPLARPVEVWLENEREFRTGPALRVPQGMLVEINIMYYVTYDRHGVLKSAVPTSVCKRLVDTLSTI